MKKSEELFCVSEVVNNGWPETHLYFRSEKNARKEARRYCGKNARLSRCENSPDNQIARYTGNGRSAAITKDMP
jgi:hypothetical protein